MKRVYIIVFTLFVISAGLTGCANKESNVITSENHALIEEPKQKGYVEGKSITANETELEIDAKDLIRYLGMKKTDVLNTLGSNYQFKALENGYDESLYYYEKLGAAFNFASSFANKEEIVEWIVCSNKVNFNGAKSGMVFKQIQEILGESEIEYSDSDNGEMIIEQFSINYKIEDHEITFISHTEDGKDSILIISNSY